MADDPIRTLFVSDILPLRPAGGAVRRMDVVTGALAGLGPVDALFLTPPGAGLAAAEAGRFGRAATVTVPPYTGAAAGLEIAARGPVAAWARHQRRTAGLPDWATGTGYDLVWFNRERVWWPLRGRIGGRVVVDVDDFEDVLLRRWLRLGRGVWDAPATRWQRVQAYRSIAWWGRVHRRVARAADVTTVSAAGDAARLRPGATVVVPNTYPSVPPAPAASRPAPVLLFQGSYVWEPNVDAAHWLVAEILPLVRERLPDVTVVLAGRSAPAVEALAGPGVEVTGAVPDMAPHLRAAGLVIVPLRVGSGTRIKILEAFAYGVPVVATTIGAEGLDLTPGEHLLIADTAAGLAEACVRLLTDPEARERLIAAAGRRHADRHLPEYAAARVREAARRAVADGP